MLVYLFWMDIKMPRHKIENKKIQIGGKMTPDLVKWVKVNGGFKIVEVAVREYKQKTEELKN